MHISNSSQKQLGKMLQLLVLQLELNLGVGDA